MLINHECPLELLETSLSFNDYEFILPLFYRKYPKYKEFMLKCKQKGRFSIMDCGLFEGVSFTNEELIDLINELKPDIFILPDVWNDANQTLANASFWQSEIEYRLPVNTNLMIVLQGTNYEEISQLIQDSIKLGIKHFGFNHLSEAYNKIYPHENKIISKMMGRIITINKLIEDDIYDIFKNCYIHLLGINNPLEIQLINKKHINSVDTSNPIIQGIKGIKYQNLEILPKPSEKIEIFMEKDLASSINNIIFNINTLRKICE